MKKELKVLLVITLFLNVLVTIVKLVFGYLDSSQALISDGYNSLVDCLTSLLLIIVIYIANKKPDKNHPYGHQKFEGIISYTMGLLMLFFGIKVIVDSIIGLINYSNNTYTFENITLIIAILALVIKLVLVFITLYAYRKYKNYSIKTDLKNHLMDAISTTVAIISILLAILGHAYFDYIGSIIIGILILNTARKIILESIGFLVDEAASKKEVLKIKQVITSVLGVISLDDLKTRKHMEQLYVDCEISVDCNLSLHDAHLIAERVHEQVEINFTDVIHCMVHVNPNANH